MIEIPFGPILENPYIALMQQGCTTADISSQLIHCVRSNISDSEIALYLEYRSANFNINPTPLPGRRFQNNIV